jgi:CheY-like chemotaxis protein
MDNSGIHILILDDDPFMRDLLSQMLSRLRYSLVTTAESGKTALDVVDTPESAPDLILCDLNMPEMDGVTFVRKLVDRKYRGSL